MSLIKSKIEKYTEKFISENFPRYKKKDLDTQFEIFVNSMHSWVVSSQSYNSNSKIGKDISLGLSQGTDSFFVLINNNIYTINDDISDILKSLENKKTTEIIFHFIQTKNTEKAKLGSFLTFVNIPLRVIKQNPMPDDENLKKVYLFIQEILKNQLLDKVTHKFELYFYTTKGENDVNKLRDDWKTDIESYKNDLKEYKEVNLEIRGSEFLNNLFELFNSNDFQLSIEKKNLKRLVDKVNKSECYIGYITATELLNCIAPETNGKRILKSDVFQHNIRLYLGDDTTVNEGIEKTLSSEPEFFHLYNNGITITTKEISEHNTYNYNISPVNIVNGCQTANSVYNACLKKPEIEKEIRIPVKIIKITDDENGKITIRSNSQNGVSETDLLAISNIQIELENKFNTNKISEYQFYYKRRNSSKEDFLNADFTIKIDDIIRAFFSSIFLMPHKVTAKFGEIKTQFLHSIFEERFKDLYYISTVVYTLIEDFLETNHLENQRIKYHFNYLFYRYINHNSEYYSLEKYFKNKNKYYDSEQDYYEKKTEEYESVSLIANKIVSNMYTIVKNKDLFNQLLTSVFENFKVSHPEFFKDLTIKQNERILYKAVSNINFDNLIENVIKSTTNN